MWQTIIPEIPVGFPRQQDNIRQVDEMQVTVSELGKHGYYSRSLAFFRNEIFFQRESGMDPDNILFFIDLHNIWGFIIYLLAKSTLLPSLALIILFGYKET